MPKPTPEPPAGRLLRIDSSASSATPGMPAFLSRPSNAPVYYGFPILDEVEVDGFRFGMITDFVASPDTAGDAFIVAPDDSRCGLVWEAEVERSYFREVLPPDQARWGVWAVGLPLPLASLEDAVQYLKALLPELKPRWASWSAKA